MLFVGVARDHRGHGYGRELLAWQTRRLVAAGATTLIADTDNANVPMARAFADVGWPQTETRIDLVPALTPGRPPSQEPLLACGADDRQSGSVRVRR